MANSQAKLVSFSVRHIPDAMDFVIKLHELKPQLCKCIEEIREDEIEVRFEAGNKGCEFLFKSFQRSVATIREVAVLLIGNLEEFVKCHKELQDLPTKQQVGGDKSEVGKLLERMHKICVSIDDRRSEFEHKLKVAADASEELLKYGSPATDGLWSYLPCNTSTVDKATLIMRNAAQEFKSKSTELESCLKGLPILTEAVKQIDFKSRHLLSLYADLLLPYEQHVEGTDSGKQMCIIKNLQALATLKTERLELRREQASVQESCLIIVEQLKKFPFLAIEAGNLQSLANFSSCIPSKSNRKVWGGIKAYRKEPTPSSLEKLVVALDCLHKKYGNLYQKVSNLCSSIDKANKAVEKHKEERQKWIRDGCDTSGEALLRKGGWLKPWLVQFLFGMEANRALIQDQVNALCDCVRPLDSCQELATSLKTRAQNVVQGCKLILDCYRAIAAASASQEEIKQQESAKSESPIDGIGVPCPLVELRPASGATLDC